MITAKLKISRRGLKGISEGKEHSIDWAIQHLSNENCYESWEEELRYLMYRYEEYLASQKGQKFSNEQWNRIWEASAAHSIEHIMPQSKGSPNQRSVKTGSIFVHRLGNLLLLPPGLNGMLADKNPIDKADEYLATGLLCAAEVANTIKSDGWGEKQVEERERKILSWVEQAWA